MTRPKCRRSWIMSFLLGALLPTPLPAAIVQTGEVSPSVSTWTFTTAGYIGRSIDGSVTVDAESLLVSDTINLGARSGSTGTATVTDVGSKWTNSSALAVGDRGNGTLTIEAGGEVSSYLGDVGKSSGSTGTATVTGTGSKWTNSNDLTVGRLGNGALAIEAGGLVSSAGGYLGDDSGSTGTAAVTGVGSKWTNQVLYVGGSGDGVLAIEAGGLVSGISGRLGDNSGSTGTATVTGAGSKWTNSGGLSVGGYGTGSLTIEDGGLVSVGGTLTIDFSSPGDSFINMATGGMLALYGNADDSLSQFLGKIQGTDAIRFWDESLSAWAPLTAATFGVDYTLEYLAAGDLAGYTLLTVGAAISPGPAGDFNADGAVDGADFLAWQRGESPDPLGAGDLDIWKNGFGDFAPSAAAAQAVVPEPTTLSLLALGLSASAIRRGARLPAKRGVWIGPAFQHCKNAANLLQSRRDGRTMAFHPRPSDNEISRPSGTPGAWIPSLPSVETMGYCRLALRADTRPKRVAGEHRFLNRHCAATGSLGEGRPACVGVLTAAPSSDQDTRLRASIHSMKQSRADGFPIFKLGRAIFDFAGATFDFGLPLGRQICGRQFWKRLGEFVNEPESVGDGKLRRGGK